MKEEAAQAVSTIIDGKTIAGVTVGGGVSIVSLMSWGELIGLAVSILVGVATLVYVCQGIRNRHEEHKNIKRRHDDSVD